jgi:hypothetical protein
MLVCLVELDTPYDSFFVPLATFVVQSSLIASRRNYNTLQCADHIKYNHTMTANSGSRMAQLYTM